MSGDANLGGASFPFWEQSSQPSFVSFYLCKHQKDSHPVQGCGIKSCRHRIEMHLQSLTHLLSNKLAENEQGSKGYSYIYRTAKKNVFMSIAIVFD